MTTIKDGKILSIIIPVFNKFNFTKACLKDLSLLPDDHEIIIVDNGSTDETQQEIIELDRSLQMKNKLVYYRNETNLGFAKACNMGYGLSAAPNVLFLNNDIRVKNDYSTWTSKLLEHCDYNSLIGPTMGQLDKQLNFEKESNIHLCNNYSYMSGWCVAASKNTWKKLVLPNYIGPFSEEFGLAYFEDTDLGFRARKSQIGFTVVDIPVVHFGKQTSKQLNTHMLYSQAKQIFVKKWGAR